MSAKMAYIFKEGNMFTDYVTYPIVCFIGSHSILLYICAGSTITRKSNHNIIKKVLISKLEDFKRVLLQFIDICSIQGIWERDRIYGRSRTWS